MYLPNCFGIYQILLSLTVAAMLLTAHIEQGESAKMVKAGAMAVSVFYPLRLFREIKMGGMVCPIVVEIVRTGRRKNRAQASAGVDTVTNEAAHFGNT
jgi:hypothetical protein